MITPKANVLGYVMKCMGFERPPCWGAVLEVLPSGNLRVKIKPLPTDETQGLEDDTVIVDDRDFIPLVELGKPCKDPDKAARGLLPEILLTLFGKVFPQKKIQSPAEMKPGTIVIVKSEKMDKIVWGVIHRPMPSGQFDVTLGHKSLVKLVKRMSVFAKPEELIPVIETDGKVWSLSRLLLKNLLNIMGIALVLLWSQKPPDPS